MLKAKRGEIGNLYYRLAFCRKILHNGAISAVPWR